MGDDLYLCIASCNSFNTSGALVGNDSFDLECITQCSQRHATLYQNTTEKYTQILQIIAVVLMTFGLIGKVFNCIIFLRPPLRGTTTGLLLFLKTIFDTFPLLWTFIFDTKFFVHDEQINASAIICALSRTTDLFVSWSIGFVILACTVRLATIVECRCLPQPTRLRVFALIVMMMLCGLAYNWHIFYYPSLVISALTDDKNSTFSYCNVIFGRQLGYFSFEGFQSTEELLYNAPIVNFIVSSLIPFAIVASTNIVIILRVLKNPSPKRLSQWNMMQQQVQQTNGSSMIDHRKSLAPNQEMTKKDVSYETTITLTTSCVFLTTNSIASIYVYVKSSHRSNRSRLTEDIKASNVYLILRMLTLIDTVLEFYIYFLTGKKFRQEVYHVINELLQHTPLRHYLKRRRCSSTNIHHRTDDYSPSRRRLRTNLRSETITRVSWPKSPSDLTHWCDPDETLDRIESTV